MTMFYGGVGTEEEEVLSLNTIKRKTGDAIWRNFQIFQLKNIRGD